MNTTKLYYSHPETMEADSAWIRLDGEPSIVLDTSPAYPEGGGQIGDTGTVQQDGVSISFIDTQKYGVGRPIVRQDFPLITVEHQVRLSLAGPIPAEWDPNKPVVVRVDAARRQRLTRSHTAAHLLWLALGERYGNLYSVVRGCHIVESQGRFDFLINKPGDEDLRTAEQIIADLVKQDLPIEMRTLSEEPECRIWVAGGREIPCGGTHLAHTTGVGVVRLRAKSKGKSGIRIIYELD